MEVTTQPDYKAKFKPPVVKKIIQSTLERLRNVEYDSDEVYALAQDLANEIRIKLKGNAY